MRGQRHGPVARTAHRHLALRLILAGIAAAGHVAYPAYLWCVTRQRSIQAVPEVEEWPGLSVVVPAYREQHYIEEKVRQLEAQAYAGPLQIVVVADDYPTYAAAKLTAAEVHFADQRRGKPSAINDGVSKCTHEIVVLNDANTHLSDDALALMIRHFQDPTVGAVAGAKRVADTAGQQYYWRFEDWLKRAESARGTTIGLVGELLAIRRSLFTPMPPGVVNDDLWLALDVIQGHGRIVYEPRAYTTEEASPGLAAEWERRTRVVAGTLRVLQHRPGSLVPGVGPVAGQLWGHRLIRSTAGPIAHMVLLGECVWSARRNRAARAVLGVHAVVGLSLAHVARGGEVPTWVRPLTQVLFLQAVGLGGFFRYLRGDKEALWPKAERMPGNGMGS